MAGSSGESDKGRVSPVSISHKGNGKASRSVRKSLNTMRFVGAVLKGRNTEIEYTALNHLHIETHVRKLYHHDDIRCYLRSEVSLPGEKRRRDSSSNKHSRASSIGDFPGRNAAWRG